MRSSSLPCCSYGNFADTDRHANYRGEVSVFEDCFTGRSMFRGLIWRRVLREMMQIPNPACCPGKQQRGSDLEQLEGYSMKSLQPEWLCTAAYCSDLEASRINQNKTLNQPLPLPSKFIMVPQLRLNLKIILLSFSSSHHQ